MSHRNLHPKKLQLELLESRVMLASVDAPSAAAQAAVDSAIDTSAAVHIDLRPLDEWLKISGEGVGNLTIDLDQLPTTLRTLWISSFDSVTFMGNANLENLVFQDIEYANAGKITLDTLFTYGVNHVRIDDAPQQILLQGADGHGSVWTRTLLEVERFSSSPVAVIFAQVENLGIASASDIERVPYIAPYTGQSILLNFAPEVPLKVADQDGVTVQIVQSGDFTRYFLGTADQRAVIESAPNFSRSLADIERVPLATLLAALKLPAAIGEGFDFGAKVHLRPLDGATSVGYFVDEETSLEIRAGEFAETVLVETRLSTAETTPEPFLQARAADVSLVPNVSEKNGQGVPQDGEALFVTTESRNDASHTDELSALSAALVRWTEPIVQTAENLQGHFASFGAIASAEVNDRLRADSRSPLLVDARSLRQREADELVVVNV